MNKTNHNPKSCKEDVIPLKNYSVFHYEASKLPKLRQSCQRHQTEKAVSQKSVYVGDVSWLNIIHLR